MVKSKWFKSIRVLCFIILSNLSAQQKPNIVFILADDMGPGDVMLYNKDAKFLTPNIDRIGREGIKFTDAHTSSAVCTPTRYGIITGRYSWRTKMKRSVLGGHSPHLISSSRETVASMLQKQGYKTACIGKWHLGMDWEKQLKSKKAPNKYNMKAPIKNGPNSVGFDYYYGISASLNMSPHVFIKNNKAQGTFEYLKDNEALKKRGYIGAKPGWSAKEFEQSNVLPTFVKKTCDWIKENSKQPFFVYMPLNSPHSPIVPSKKFKGKSGLNAHGDFCMETDWAVGEVLKTLEQLKIADNTLVVFTSDNGTSPKAKFKFMADRGHHPSWIYRGMKGTNWEGGHRMPFVAKWPKKIKPNQISNALICTTDFMATCAEIVGVKLKDNQGEDSLSFLSILEGKKSSNHKNRTIIHHSDRGVFSVRTNQWKLMFDNHGGSKRGDVRRKEPIINNADILLFDMQKDAVENNNLAQSHPKIVEKLKKKLATIIVNGRSTLGKTQLNDSPSGKGWPELQVVKEYLDKESLKPY